MKSTVATVIEARERAADDARIKLWHAAARGHEGQIVEAIDAYLEAAGRMTRRHSKLHIVVSWAANQLRILSEVTLPSQREIRRIRDGLREEIGR